MTSLRREEGRRPSAPRDMLLARAVLLLCALGFVPTVLAAQEEQEAGGAALFDVNLGLTLWTVVIFLALVAILWKFAWGPILAAAATREERIQRALDEAASRQAEALELMQQQKAQLADARRQVQEIINEGKTAGERVRRDIEEKARSEAQSIVERARKDITREKDAALDELRRESVDLALAAAAKLMDRKLDPQSDRELILGYINDLSNTRGEGAKA